MRLIGCAALVAAALASCGCLIVSLSPVYDDLTIEFDDRLVGTWDNAEDGTSVVISRGTWRSYDVTYEGRSGQLKLTAYGTRIGTAHFLDVAPVHGMEAPPLQLAAHAIVRVQLLGDALTVNGLDYEWWTRAALQGELKKLRYAMDERKNLVLTSPTSVLREWIAGSLKSDEVYGDAITFVRRR